MDESSLLVGRIGRSFGVRGFVRVLVLSDNPARFLQDLGEVFLLVGNRGGRNERRLALEDVKEQGGGLLLKWKGIDSPEEVRNLAGWQIFWTGPDDWIPEPDEGIRLAGLVGFSAFDCDSLRAVGTVSGYYERSGQDLLQIETAEGEVLCPFVDYLVPRISQADREVYLRWSVVGTSE